MRVQIRKGNKFWIQEDIPLPIKDPHLHQGWMGRLIVPTGQFQGNGDGGADTAIGKVKNVRVNDDRVTGDVWVEAARLSEQEQAVYRQGVFELKAFGYGPEEVPSHFEIAFGKENTFMSNCSKIVVNPQQDPEPLVMPSLEEAFKRNAREWTDADTFKEIESRKEDNKPIERQISDGLNPGSLEESLKAKLAKDREKAAKKAPPKPTVNEQEPEGLEVPDLAEALRSKWRVNE